ncbi:glycoside hydrolase family 3 C-terminal domain-containing protein [Anaerolinea thermophila]|uniref:Beta-glucosidase n=1 Tax=Anaerolinea thermophila (strain DSM 14523 / JCM 11388 / NBRC 100420 / UNI-1) TaxID=926569 RepID=E8MZH4_ANATU|nr:glycoside hydrolase family 3 C-terminal domain-containing protein [Anaerolinea thermophila]BAJ64522.1 beta-glucosidase [Anaerolinea thermophila UNI-1]
MLDIEAILSQMTLEEKAAFCTGATPWSTLAIERLGVPSIVMTDGPHGVRRASDPNTLTAKSLPATCFPTASCSASTWNPTLLQRMGEAMAEEAIALKVDILLGPGVNMKRSPLGGRNFEYFSEDPYLAGEMAVALINGIQSKGVGTSIKHYAANNQEFERFTISAEVDERTLREIYLPAFEAAVKRAKPWTVMCAYNKVNGTFASEHHQLLTEILKEEWGFEGVVVSDWGAVRDRVKSLVGGVDLEMPGPKHAHVRAVVEAVKSGQLSEEVLNESVRRMLRLVDKAMRTPKGGAFDVDAHHALARQIAAEGMVLLKNNGILPLKDIRKAAVIGRSAREPYFQGGGSSNINPTRVDVPLDELQKQGEGIQWTYAEGYAADESLHPEMIDEAVDIARDAEVALIFVALPPSKESEGYDRQDLDLSRQQVALIQAVAKVQPNTVVILNNGAPIVMSEWIDGVAAVLEAWMMGQAGAGAIADILFGKVNPSGKLAETFPLRLADTPAYLNWPGEAGKVRYGEGLYIGYRYYDAREDAVLFPFGFGLSYTTFEYSNPRVSAQSFRDVDGVTVYVDVTNTGKVAGKETVQVYVHDRQASLSRPVKELKGFAKVELQPGETKTVAIPLDFRAFAFYHPEYHQWVTESGEFDILIGASSADIRHTLTVTLESTLELPCILDMESTVREWLADPRGKAVFGPMFDQMRTQMARMMGGDEASNEMIGMDMMGFMMDMPVVSVLGFQEANLPAPAEVVVADLLAKVHGKA